MQESGVNYMATTEPRKPNECSPACSKIIKFVNFREFGPNVGYGSSSQEVDGYRYINIFVQWTKSSSDDLPVDLYVSFYADDIGSVNSSSYVNLEQNLPNPQTTNFIQVSSIGSYWGISRSYIARLPIMGPFIRVSVENKAPEKRTINVWGYLVS